MGSTIAWLGLSLLTTLASQQPEVAARSAFRSRQYQLDCLVVLHQANGQQKLMAEPTLTSIAGRPAEFVSGGSTSAGKPFGTVLSFLVDPTDTAKLRLQADLELSKHVGDGVVETIVRFQCDKLIEPGKTIRLKKKDPRHPDQCYRATFRLTEVRPPY